MVRRNDDRPRHGPVEERRRKTEKLLQKMRRAGTELLPVTIAGRAIATGFWGRAWCDNLETHRAYESRLPRGRADLRHGSVLDLRIAAGRIDAIVGGAEIYRVGISVKPTAKTQWRALCAACAGEINALADLLQGRLTSSITQRLRRHDGGLLPRPSDLRFTCTCPEPASKCKHVAAVLYGVGARLDREADLLFRLRAVEAAELVAGADRPSRRAAAQTKAGRAPADMTEVADLPPPKDETPRQPEAAEPKPTASQQDVADAINALARALGQTVPVLKPRVLKPTPKFVRPWGARTRSSGSP